MLNKCIYFFLFSYFYLFMYLFITFFRNRKCRNFLKSRCIHVFIQKTSKYQLQLHKKKKHHHINHYKFSKQHNFYLVIIRLELCGLYSAQVPV